ncbi:NAD(P)/FAD-dependent oxidoreductase [Halorhabdus sp. CUG00001]|uniref:NAD(P)/FAD-dependent oxidoreductase n=1 Tax=Halorhabdus sp. CUG00001 TaxID=2600297 RepID=UPI00131A97CA|nr:FAD-dependent oxidoreductase [Halorhabdus sp. CUG00001]
MADVAIIGGGPAGLAAAVYTARADQETLVFDKGDGTTRDVDWMENVYGFPEGASGPELVDVGQEQATKFGAEIVEEEVVQVGEEGNGYGIETEVDEYAVEGVILATGASYESPAIKDVDDYEGGGVSYCVECDAFFYQDAPVAVVGAGNYAAKEAMMLLDYTDDVRILTNGKTVEIDDALLERLAEEGIELIEAPADRIVGDDVVEGVELKSGDVIDVEGVFVALGAAGGTDIADMLGIPRDGDYLDVDGEQYTGVDRVYAAGDITGGQRQVNVSVGEGTTAAINLLEDFRGGEYVDYKKIEA